MTYSFLRRPPAILVYLRSIFQLSDTCRGLPNGIFYKSQQLILASLLFIYGCTTVTLDFDETIAVRGSIVTSDEFGVINNDQQEVTVRLSETGFSTQTDKNGLFILQDVPFGTYDLIIEKAGYGTRILNGYSFLNQQMLTMRIIRIQPIILK